jgi:hypothetical protein
MKRLEMTRLDYLQTGIFGSLIDPDNTFAVFTLERAYPVAPESTSVNWTPKVAPGIYTCIRRLSPKFGYDLFMLENVPPFQGQPVDYIELHIANWENQLEGCIALGMERQNDTAILESTEAFNALMKNLVGLNEFTLEIK